jgi:hypothetical protein
MADIVHKSVYFTGGALKAYNDGRVGGYLVVFTGPNDRDSYGEYFTRDTDYGLNWYQNQPVLYHHGQNDEMVTPIGIIDSLKVDDHGLYAEAQLDINHEDPTIRDYARTAYGQVTSGKLFWSSGSATHLVRITEDGCILQWPVIEGSLTPKPAEERGRTYVEVIRAAIRALLDEQNHEQTAKEPSTAKEPVETQALSNRRHTMMQRRNTPTQKMDMATIMSVLDANASLDDAAKWALAKELAAADAGEEMMEGEPIAADSEVPPAADMTPVSEPIAAAPRSQMTPQEVAAQILQAMRTHPAQAPLPAGGGPNPTQPRAPHITVRTAYHDLSAVDMSYMYEMRKGMVRSSGKGQIPDVKFKRELLEKTQRELSYESSASRLKMAPQDANAIMSIKDNELDNSLTAGQILEWIPTIWSSELWRRVRLDNEVASSFRTVEMPSDPYNLPVESTDPTVYLVPETTNEAQLTLASSANPIPDSVVGSAKVTLNAQKLALRVGFSSEAEEDSIIPFIPQLREQGIRAMANAVDNVLLNGDTATGASVNINDIDGTPAATAKYLIFNGLLKNALVTTSGQSINLGNSAPTLATIRALRSKLQSTLNVYGLRPDDLVMFVDPYTWFKMLSIDEINAWLNNGRNATVNNGMLPNIDGIPIWPSQELALANSAGKIQEATPSTSNVYGRIVMAAKTGWTIGYRRQITTNMDYLSYYDSYQFTATLRIAFINKDGFASSAAFGVNVS